jgi:uncharacterized protein
MRRVFADTLYWVAITHRKDHWHQAAVAISRTLPGCQFVTTDELLVEVLAAFCEAGPHLRKRAATLVRNLYQKASVTVRPQTRDTLLTGLTLYEARLDKGYSLTDCVSMEEAMRQGGITDILTHDAHFSQEGFTLML